MLYRDLRNLTMGKITSVADFRNLVFLALVIKREYAKEELTEFSNIIKQIFSKDLFEKVLRRLMSVNIQDMELLEFLKIIVNTSSEKELVECILNEEKENYFLGTRSTPQALIELMLKLLEIKEDTRIVDAFSGEGNIGLEIKRQIPNVVVDCYEINAEANLIANMKAYAMNVKINCYQQDLFIQNIDEKYDYAVADIPFINKYDIKIHESLDSIYHRLNFRYMPSRVSGSYVCALKLLDCIKENGRVVTTFLPGGLFNTLDKEIRKYLIENNYIEKIINLPANILYGTNIATSIMVLSKNKNTDYIEMIDLENCIIKKRPVSELDIKKSLEKVEKESVKVAIEEIIKNEYSLNINVYTKKVELEYSKLLSDLTEDMFRGYQITSSQIKEMAVTKEKEANYKVLEISNIDDDGNIEEINNFINSKERNLDRYLLKKGDILLSARGEKTKIAIFDKEDENVIANGSINVIRVNNKINSIFLKMFFESEKGKISLNNIKSGVTIPSLNIGDLQKLSVSCPDFETQNNLVSKYTLKAEIINSTKKRLAELKKEMNDIVNLI